MKAQLRVLFLLVLMFGENLSAQESVCYGTTAEGRLKGGVELAYEGKNYLGYSRVARMAGRNYVHSAVKTIIVKAYRQLEIEQPDKVYKYAETGFEQGGRFKPHKTHQNGLSVDFMTPVVDKEGLSVHLPTHPFNRFGYDIEFDKNNHYDELSIDYLALAAHIVELHKAAQSEGFDLWRVIFDPKLQPGLFKTKYASYLTQHINFSKKPSWVRHDEHYHIDFLIPCV